MGIRRSITNRKPTLTELANMPIDMTANALKKHYGVDLSETPFSRGERLLNELETELRERIKLDNAEELPEAVSALLAGLQSLINELCAGYD